MTDSTASASSSAGGSALTRWLVGLVAAVFVVSVSARAMLGVDGGQSPSPSSPPPGGAAFAPTIGAPPTESTQPESSGSLEALLPVLTEASFFALIGFGLGYAAKKVAKLLLIVLALGFLLVQGLGYADVVTVDWSKLVDLLNTWILNIKEDETITDWLTHSLPTGGALIGGVLLGFKKG